MLYRIRSNSWYILTKFVVKDCQRWLRGLIQPLPQYHDSKHLNPIPLIDENLTVHGKAKWEAAHKLGYLHPVVHVVVFSPDGKYVLVQKRGANVATPGKISQTVGGHLHYSEQLDDQTLKPDNPIVTKTRDGETGEETGLTGLSFSFISNYPHSSPSPFDQAKINGNQEIVLLFKATHQGAVFPQTAEVSWFGWFSFQGLCKLALKHPERFAPSFRQDLENLKKNEISLK